MLNYRFLKTVIPCLVVAIAGCGGGGGTHGGSHTDNNYAGTYGGVFLDASGRIGNFSMTVATTGDLDGQFIYSVAPKQFGGSVLNKGTGTITTTAGSSALTLTLSMDPTLGGTVADTNGNGANFAAITNPNGVFGGSNPFTGDFAGTVHNSTINETGVDAFVIDSSGNIGGTGLVNVNGVPTFSHLEGSISASGAMIYTIVATNVTLQGNVTIANGTISGNLTGSNGDSLTISIAAVQP